MTAVLNLGNLIRDRNPDIAHYSDDELKKQYLSPINDPSKWPINYGGSCDNDVHEHFKCLVETVFGKAFIHETEAGFQTYNCMYKKGQFVCDDSYLREWIIYSKKQTTMTLNGRETLIQQGMNVIKDKREV